VPQVRVGIERNGREEDDDRFMQCVGGFYRYIERGIVDAALGALHPVDNTETLGIGIARAPDGNSRIIGKVCDGIHGTRNAMRTGKDFHPLRVKICLWRCSFAEPCWSAAIAWEKIRLNFS